MWQIVFAILAVLGSGVAVAAIVFWDDIRDRLAGWLRRMGWQKSALMDALVRLDRLAGQVRCRLLATTRAAATHQIDETHYDMDQIDDAEVKAELLRRGLAERSVLHLVN